MSREEENFLEFVLPPLLIGLLIKGNNDKKLKFLKIIFHVVGKTRCQESRHSRLTTFFVRYFSDFTSQPVLPFSAPRENVNESSKQKKISLARNTIITMTLLPAAFSLHH